MVDINGSFFSITLLQILDAGAVEWSLRFVVVTSVKLVFDEMIFVLPTTGRVYWCLVGLADHIYTPD